MLRNCTSLSISDRHKQSNIKKFLVCRVRHMYCSRAVPRAVQSYSLLLLFCETNDKTAAAVIDELSYQLYIFFMPSRRLLLFLKRQTLVF